MSESEPGSDEPELIRLDEDFIRSASVKEPSARARMLAQKWAAEPPTDTRRWREGGVDADWRPTRRRRSSRVVVALVAILAVIGTGLGVAVLYRPGSGGAPTHAGPPAASVQATIDLPNGQSTLSPANPFLGPPANGYADNAAGIVLPAAAAKGNFTRTEVAAALQTARAYLIAADLDRTTLLGRSGAKAGALLDPHGSRQDLNAALRNPTADNDPLNYLTRFDPTETRLVGSVIKLHGTTTYFARGADELVVHMDYLSVYPVQRPRGGPVTRVVVRHVYNLSIWHHRDVTRGTLWLGEASSYAAGVACATTHGYLHPQWPGQAPEGTGAPSDPYNQSGAVNGRGTCGTATRT